MVNLLDQLQTNKSCQVCGKIKPLSAFAISTTAQGKNIYSQICNICRQQTDDDDEEGGGKQNSLRLDSNAKQTILEQQLEDKEQFSLEKETYIDEIDNQHREEQKKHLEENKKNLQRNFLNDYIRQAEKLPNSLLDQDRDWAKSTASSSTEFGFNPDVHDPFRQIPNAAHHFLYITHPDRMDVKFLLEYVISGDYAQHYTDRIGPSKRGNYPIGSIMISPGNVQVLPTGVDYLHQAGQDIIHIKISQGTPAVYTTSPPGTLSQQSITPTQVQYHTNSLMPVTSSALTPGISTLPLNIAIFRVIPVTPTATTSVISSNSYLVSNPSSFTAGSQQAIQLQNASQAIGYRLIEEAKSIRTSLFQQGLNATQKNVGSAQNKADQVIGYIKNTWGNKR